MNKARASILVSVNVKETLQSSRTAGVITRGEAGVGISISVNVIENAGSDETINHPRDGIRITDRDGQMARIVQSSNRRSENKKWSRAKKVISGN